MFTFLLSFRLLCQYGSARTLWSCRDPVSPCFPGFSRFSLGRQSAFSCHIDMRLNRRTCPSVPSSAGMWENLNEGPKIATRGCLGPCRRRDGEVYFWLVIRLFRMPPRIRLDLGDYLPTWRHVHSVSGLRGDSIHHFLILSLIHCGGSLPSQATGVSGFLSAGPRD